MPFYERNEEGKLIPAKEVPEEAIQAIERASDEQIAQRLTTGVASDACFYSYSIKTKTGTREIIGISTKGADEIALMLGNIEILPGIAVDKDSDPDYFYASVRAKDLTRNVTLMGTGRTCKYYETEGRKPDYDRINEWAFASAVSKAHRDAILRLVPVELEIKAIEAFKAKGKGKSIIAPPKLEEVEEKTKSSANATPSITQEQIAEQQKRLKKLRMDVHNRFQSNLGIGVEKRKEMLKERFGVDSLNDLSEQQLKECLSWVEELIQERTIAPPAKTVANPETKAKELGFESASEQNKLRGRLYSLLTSQNQLGLSDEEAKKFIADRGYTTGTIDTPKEKLLALIQEAERLVETKQIPTEF